jgi:EAL and modified HD-GYP domain-containing signal transduction protein
MAAMRGKLMELLADKLHPGSHDHGESAFMIGILSLIDVLFGTSMEDITSKLNLTDDIRQALLSRNGELGELLNLVERLEKLDFEGVAKSLTAVGLSIEQLLEAQLQGINWTSKLAENM